jgi:hypothetical protein
MLAVIQQQFAVKTKHKDKMVKMPIDKIEIKTKEGECFFFDFFIG